MIEVGTTSDPEDQARPHSVTIWSPWILFIDGIIHLSFSRIHLLKEYSKYSVVYETLNNNKEISTR